MTTVNKQVAKLHVPAEAIEISEDEIIVSDVAVSKAQIVDMQRVGVMESALRFILKDCLNNSKPSDVLNTYSEDVDDKWRFVVTKRKTQ